MVYPPKTRTWLLTPIADEPSRPATPGTDRPSVHLPDLKRSTNTLLVMSSHVFFVPTPIMEYTSVPFLRAATELLLTALGIAGILDSSAADRKTAKKTGSRKAERFFIVEILRLSLEPRQSAFPAHVGQPPSAAH